MTQQDNGGPAFPLDPKVSEAHYGHADAYHGMSLRDYFAAKAMQGCLAYRHVSPMHGNWQENSTPENIASFSYEVADAMVKAGKPISLADTLRAVAKVNAQFKSFSESRLDRSLSEDDMAGTK